ncbi:MAG: phytanoyl-CoA dioxygenase family protein [Gammaproteobacteria bacterium]|nr:phytanoyl-CoA dioxygenase family protein [Gammaproteobacteria bacterium]
MNKQFENDGFLHIKQAFSLEEVENLIKATESILENDDYKKDLLSIDATGHTHKILYPLGKHPLFLQSLVHPSLLDILLKTMDNPLEIVPTWEDVLIKLPYCGIPVTFHQDLALQSSKYDIFSLGLYFHSSEHNPVRYLPGSHRLGALTKKELYEVSEARIDQFVPIIAEPGDIIMHKVKTIHYSETNKTPFPRYTWYLEFRTLSQLYDDSPWDEDWILARRAIFAHALHTYQPAYYNTFIQDETKLEPYLNHLNLRIPHETETVKYDMQSPYNHFAY